MNIIWARALVTLLLQGLVGALVGWRFGAAAGCGAFAALLWLQALANAFHIQRLWRLLDAPVYGEVPSALGTWGEIYYRLHRLTKRWHGQVRQVEQQHARFIQAMQASPNGVVMLDEHHQIEWCNAIAERHFGLNARRDTGQSITHLLRQPEFVRYMAMQRYEEALVMPNMGEQRHNVLSVQIFPYGDDRKLVLSQDITELERTETMRRDFVANVSHELKTPLTVLSGFLETIDDLPLSDEERGRYLGIMRQQTERMQHIVSDLLTLARLEGDTRTPVDAPLDMARVLRRLQDDAAVLSQGRHDVRVTCATDLVLLGDEGELLSAFSNLVSNAVRYTPDGGRVDILWEAGEADGDGEAGGGAVFSVRDTGLGIPADHIPRLTERFYRIDRSRSRDTGGTGLGLAIVKHVLTRHHAWLDIQSIEGQGSTFSIHFPAARVRKATAGGTQSPSRTHAAVRP